METSPHSHPPAIGWRRWLLKIGIDVPLTHRWRVHLLPRFFVTLGIGFCLFLVGLLGMATYSTSPAFCNSCHIMTPYYEAWRTSQHYGKAKCVDCHYPPSDGLGELLWHKFQASSQVVKYITRTYSSKPFAEIEDASCLRSGCHSTRLLEGQVLTKHGIRFDHRPHLSEPRRGRQLRCVSCHSQIVVGTHVEVTYSSCFLCHFRDGKTGDVGEPGVGCQGCHNLPEQSFQVGNMSFNHQDFVVKRGLACKNCHLDVTEGEGKAEKDRCFTCHNQPEKLEKYDDIPFLHENHVTKHNVACLHCHKELKHGFQEAGKAAIAPLNRPAVPESFLTRHRTPALAFDCNFCHEQKHVGQLEMYSGRVDSLGLPNIPSPMYTAQVDCVGCHYREQKDKPSPEFGGVTVAAAPQACIKCHGEAFTGMWEEAQSALKATLAALDKKIELVKEALAKATLAADALAPLHTQFAQVTRWHDFVRFARGEHNVYLASAALRKEDAALGELGSALKVPLPDTTNLPLLNGSYCATMCHTKLGVLVPPATVQVDGKTMPHKAHTEMMGCASCHELGGHKDVPLHADIKTTLCAGCHAE
ncbi:MAG: NapC/NirT family cytochrome c [Deltaproteobacteria bacterium]|nr:NapC/NirT family cytochrome c [Deltaproteobacteria bacterium]